MSAVRELLKAGRELTLRHVLLMQSKLRFKPTLPTDPSSELASFRKAHDPHCPEPPETDRIITDRTRPSGSATPLLLPRTSTPFFLAKPNKSIVIHSERARSREKPKTAAEKHRGNQSFSEGGFRKDVRRIAAPLSRKVIPDRFVHCKRRVSVGNVTLEEVMTQIKSRNSLNVKS